MNTIYLFLFPLLLFATPIEYKALYPTIWKKIISEKQSCEKEHTTDLIATLIKSDFILEMNEKIDYNDLTDKDVDNGKNKTQIEEFSTLI